MLLPTILGLVFDLTVQMKPYPRPLHACTSGLYHHCSDDQRSSYSSTTKGDVISASNWFMFMALASFIFGSQFRFLENWLTQPKQFGSRAMSQSWTLIALSSQLHITLFLEHKSPDLVRFNDQASFSSCSLHYLHSCYHPQMLERSSRISVLFS